MSNINLIKMLKLAFVYILYTFFDATSAFQFSLGGRSPSQFLQSQVCGITESENAVIDGYISALKTFRYLPNYLIVDSVLMEAARSHLTHITNTPTGCRHSNFHRTPGCCPSDARDDDCQRNFVRDLNYGDLDRSVFARVWLLTNPIIDEADIRSFFSTRGLFDTHFTNQKAIGAAISDEYIVIYFGANKGIQCSDPITQTLTERPPPIETEEDLGRPTLIFLKMVNKWRKIRGSAAATFSKELASTARWHLHDSHVGQSCREWSPYKWNGDWYEGTVNPCCQPDKAQVIQCSKDQPSHFFPDLTGNINMVTVTLILSSFETLEQEFQRFISHRDCAFLQTAKTIGFYLDGAEFTAYYTEETAGHTPLEIHNPDFPSFHNFASCADKTYFDTYGQNMITELGQQMIKNYASISMHQQLMQFARVWAYDLAYGHGIPQTCDEYYNSFSPSNHFPAEVGIPYTYNGCCGHDCLEDTLKSIVNENSMFFRCNFHVYDNGVHIGDVYDAQSPDFSKAINNATGVMAEAFSEGIRSSMLPGWQFDSSTFDVFGFASYGSTATFVLCNLNSNQNLLCPMDPISTTPGPPTSSTTSPPSTTTGQCTCERPVVQVYLSYNNGTIGDLPNVNIV